MSSRCISGEWPIPAIAAVRAFVGNGLNWSDGAIGFRRQRTAAIPAAWPKAAIPRPAPSQPFAPVPAALQNAYLEFSTTGDYWDRAKKFGQVQPTKYCKKYAF